MKGRKPYARLPLHLLKLRFVSDYYDHPLAGVCFYEGEWMEFYYPPENGLKHYSRKNKFKVHLFRLTAWEKLKWAYAIKLFEVCVGRHWSFPNNTMFEHSKSHPYLFNLYYKLPNFLKGGIDDY